jgi:exodeoxyribonuclease VII large subunit
MARRLGQDRLRIEGLGRGLPDPSSLINAAQQRLDDRAERLALGIKQRLRQVEQALRALGGRVNANLLRGEIARRGTRAAELGPRLQTALDRRIAQERNRADHVAGRLLTAYQALRKPLLRGYAMVRDAKGKLVIDAAKMKQESALTLEFHDGKVQVFTESKQGKLL